MRHIKPGYIENLKCTIYYFLVNYGLGFIKCKFSSTFYYQYALFSNYISKAARDISLGILRSGKIA